MSYFFSYTYMYVYICMYIYVFCIFLFVNLCYLVITNQILMADWVVKPKKKKKNEKTVCPKTFSTLPFHKNKINWYKSVFSVFSISWYLINPRILICTLYWEKEYTFTLVLLFTVVVGITVIDVWTKRPSKFEKCTKGYFVV